MPISLTFLDDFNHLLCYSIKIHSLSISLILYYIILDYYIISYLFDKRIELETTLFGYNLESGRL